MSTVENYHTEVYIDTPKSTSEYTQNEMAIDNETLPIETDLNASSGVEIILQPTSEMNSPIAQHVLADNPTSALPISSSSYQISSDFSRSHSETLRNVGMGACITVCVLFLVSLILCIPIAELVIGIKYQHQCPIQPKIPIYLIVTGSLTVFMLVVSCAIPIGIFALSSSGRSTGSCLTLTSMFLNLLISLFVFVWLIIGSVWIYSIANRVQYTNPINPNYCDKVLYQFAYVITIITWISLGFSCCQSCFKVCHSTD